MQTNAKKLAYNKVSLKKRNHYNQLRQYWINILLVGPSWVSFGIVRWEYQRTYSTSGPVSTGMGDCLRAENNLGT